MRMDKNIPLNLLCSTYDGQELLDVLDGSLGLCPTYFPPGQECTLPLNPGAYGSLVGGDLYIVLPEIANDLSKYIYQTHTRICTYYSQCCAFLPTKSSKECTYRNLKKNIFIYLSENVSRWLCVRRSPNRMGPLGKPPASLALLPSRTSSHTHRSPAPSEFQRRYEAIRVWSWSKPVVDRKLAVET